MPILFRCEHCRQKLSISSRKGGTVLKCPKCAQDIMVPIPEATLIEEEEKPAAPPQKSPLPPTREMETSAHRDEPKKPEVNPWGVTREIRERPGAMTEAAPLRPSFSPSLEPPPRPVPPIPARPMPKSEEEDEFTLRRPRAEQDEMDLTPMVDVTFLLLIFFMITASFSLTKTIETPPPDPDKKGAQTIQNMEELEMTSIMARIDDQDNIFLDDEPVDAADLETVLGDKLRAEQKNELIIQASPLCRHETFVNVFDAATGAGMQKIRLATSKGEE